MILKFDLRRFMLPLLISLIISACSNPNLSGQDYINASTNYPKIASWLAKKDEIIASGKPYDLVMTGWFMSEEAEQIKANNPDALLLAGLSTNWIWANEDWLTFLETVASYGGTPLALFEDAGYELHEVALSINDVVVMFTDGVTEAMNDQWELFGIERLEAVVKQYSKASSEELANLILKAVRQFTSGAIQSDDITLLILRRTQ